MQTFWKIVGAIAFAALIVVCVLHEQDQRERCAQSTACATGYRPVYVHMGGTGKYNHGRMECICTIDLR